MLITHSPDATYCSHTLACILGLCASINLSQFYRFQSSSLNRFFKTFCPTRRSIRSCHRCSGNICKFVVSQLSFCAFFLLIICIIINSSLHRSWPSPGLQPQRVCCVRIPAQDGNKVTPVNVVFSRLSVNYTNFHNKNFALSLPLTMRFKASRKWPIRSGHKKVVVITR